ncbi:UDP-N-acetylenolpyruvoylglucosamine reductase [Dissulfuribacter thermophilus]|uniref:UDP-N-acetylenolpyruvoylglucosamine reductase n=1 Tax=Dissulfuribacter thermophilus TaxID=1156395 RepID=A0A1B9F4K4_9BACT|nr:UDP-N-acetylmuramate dehydrogenase [Dissulfuribacter thermophilus]OCC14754.1 UDP-N-acetylenolpyruvoylglucosamine reductase [Dissulfuribacter thermophilus]
MNKRPSRQLFEKIYTQLKGIPDIWVKRDSNLSSLTTFKIGGDARLWIAPLSVDALVSCLGLLKDNEIDFHILGGGSNVIISDHGVDCVLDTRGLAWIKSIGEGQYEVGAGFSLKRLVALSVKNGLSGCEGLAGIPGSVGGAIAMNAGGKNVAIGDLVTHLLIADSGGTRWIPREKVQFGYRKCVIEDRSFNSTLNTQNSKLLMERSFNSTLNTQNSKLIIAGARISLQKSRERIVRDYVLSIMDRRKKTQPLGKPSAGCIFKNPRSTPAGKLIEMAGLKGMQCGGAAVSVKHANFIVNLDRARAQDVVDLIKRVREKVFENFNVLLEPEVKTMGVSL